MTTAFRMGPVRRALLALAFGSFGLATGEFVMLGLLPNVAASVHVSIPTAGYLIAAYALGVVIGAPLLTAVSVRLPRKGLVIGLVLALAVGNFGRRSSPDTRHCSSSAFSRACRTARTSASRRLSRPGWWTPGDALRRWRSSSPGSPSRTSSACR